MELVERSHLLPDLEKGVPLGKIVYLTGKPGEAVEVEASEDVEYIEQFQGKEPADEKAVLFKLGSDKEAGILNATWDEVAGMMNELFRKGMKPDTESTWRKKYARLRDEIGVEQQEEVAQAAGLNLEPIKDLVRSLEKKRMQERDERMAYTRQVRTEARQDMILNLFRETIEKYPKVEVPEKPKEKKTAKAVYAMLSDIHYGLMFDSYVGIYNTSIARDRVLAYADEIILTGKLEKADICFVSLMGDMISGIIHPTIRVENKENAIEQVVGVSEVVSSFLYYLSRHFTKVYVNAVDGNHSRLDPNLENALRKERLDALIPWYCKAKLANQENVEFVDADFDQTVGTFYIGKKLFVAVHGDLEKDLKTTANMLEKLMGRHIDYMLAGHMHVPEMRAEDTMYIRNGSICGSGDDYTMKKRLFCPPYQVFMILDGDGAVESIHTVNLEHIGAVEEKAVAA